MTTETDYLQSIADEIYNNKRNDEFHPNHHLKTETKRLEKAIIHSLNTIENFTQRDTFHFNTLSRLVNICDTLFDATQTVNPDVIVLIELLTAVKQVIPDELRPNLKLPKAFIAMQKATFIEYWAIQRERMYQNEIPEKLIAIAAIPFQRFIEPEQTLFWGDFTWLKGYQSKLDIMDWQDADCHSPAEALMSLLIGRDFNHDRFYVYCKKYIEVRTAAILGKRNRLLEFAQCEKLVLQDTQVGSASFDNHANSVNTRLIKWIKEEIDFVETYEREQPFAKFEFDWNVEMISLFFKLLHEVKVFGKTGLKSLSETISATCSSMSREEFQAGTVHSRFYTKDLLLLKAMEELLVRMLEIIRRYLR